MNVQSIDLSPYEVLKRFCEMEVRLPHRGEFKFYKTTFRFFVNNDDDLAQTCQVEAENMMNHVGLIGYTPVIKFEKLNAAAGNINLNPSKTVNINLDESVRGDYYAIMATIAHEICHKLLYNSNFYYTDSLMKLENEVLADIATFYVGFGNHTMKGFYRKTDSTECRRGYLTPKTYGLAYIISCRINGQNHYETDLPEHSIKAIHEANQYLDSDFFFNRLDEKAINESFIKAGQSASQVLQKLDCLIGLLQLQRTSILDYDRKIHDLFYDNPSLHMKAPQATPYLALAAKHLQMKDLDLRQIKALDERLGRNINSFIPILSKILVQKGVPVSEFEHKTPCCPFCSHVSKTDWKEEKVYHFICPNCHKHFVVDFSRGLCEPTMDVKKCDDYEEVVSKKVEYVYVGANQVSVYGIPLKKRMQMFLRAFRDAWKNILIPAKSENIS